METIRKTVTFTDQQNNWIKAQVEKGDFTNDSEYLRSLVRRHQAESEKLSALRTAIDEGWESGESEENVSSIWQRVKAKSQASKSADE